MQGTLQKLKMAATWRHGKYSSGAISVRQEGPAVGCGDVAPRAGVSAGASQGFDPAPTRSGAEGHPDRSEPGCGSEDGSGIARRFKEEGLESALNEKPRPGKPRVLDTKQSQRIIAMVCGSAPEGRARWTVRLIAEEAVKRKLAPQVGRETIRVLLESHELKPWREKNVVHRRTE
jgi:transposase